MDRVSRPDSLCYPMARDGELVVMHDPDVPRTTDGHGHVKDMTLTEIKSLDASIRWAPQYQGERVPTLAEVLAWAKERIELVIEIKGNPLVYLGIDPFGVDYPDRVRPYLDRTGRSWQRVKR